MRIRTLAVILQGVCCISAAHAGGGPANVLVLYNDADSDSLAIAEYYADARAIPPGHLCAVFDVDPTARTIDFDDYDTSIRAALDDCLATLPQPEEIHTLVLTRGLPYRIDIPDGFSTSLSAMLQVADTFHRDDGSPLAGEGQASSGGTYAASIQNPVWVGGGDMGVYTIDNPFSSSYLTAPQITGQAIQLRAFTRRDMDYGGTWNYSTGLFLVWRLDGFDANDAMDLVDRAVAADESFPTAPLTCMHAADQARGARDPECEYTIRMLQSAGFSAQWIDTFDEALAGEEMAAYLTGTTDLQNAIDANTYAPGAFGCNLTSYGATPGNFFCDETGTTCPESESQTSIARLVRGGLTGAHGTVAEPLNNSFPGAGMLLLYTMGYNMAESAFLTQRYLYWQNIYLGDPLTSPWATRPEVTFDADGTLPIDRSLTIMASHPDGIQSIALYVDGTRQAETEGGTLTVELDGMVGDTQALLAIATASNGAVTRIGWPEPEQQPQSNVQGWVRTTITLGDAVGEQDTGLDAGSAPTDTADSEAGAPDKGCGCSGAPLHRSARWWGIWVVALVLRRRA